MKAEDIAFLRKWHLVNSEEEFFPFKKYRREGEAPSSGNAGAWYSAACYWRERCERAEEK